MIVNFISVLAIATNSSHHRASLRTRAHGSRFFARSRGATCATLTRTPLRRSLSAMVGMSFSATPTHQTNLSTQKPSLGIFTAHKDRRRCSQWVEGSIPSALTLLPFQVLAPALILKLLVERSGEWSRCGSLITNAQLRRSTQLGNNLLSMKTRT